MQPPCHPTFPSLNPSWTPRKHGDSWSMLLSIYRTVCYGSNETGVVNSLLSLDWPIGQRSSIPSSDSDRLNHSVPNGWDGLTHRLKVRGPLQLFWAWEFGCGIQHIHCPYFRFRQSGQISSKVFLRCKPSRALLSRLARSLLCKRCCCCCYAPCCSLQASLPQPGESRASKT